MQQKMFFSVGWFMVLAWVCLAGCMTGPPLFLEPGDPLPETLAIKPCIQKWSRHVQKHDRWSTVLDVDAVFLSWDVRMAILERTLADRDIDPETAAAMREREQQLFQGYVEFYLAVMTTKDEWNNLAEEEPAWNLYLVCEGEEQASFRVEEVELDPALTFTHFPQQSHFKKYYKVSFIRQPRDRALPLVHKNLSSFELLLKGFFGQARLTWDLG
ncbi:hypothetical protein JXQ70_15445 [bacterium]|nr:hypothetical protein [bacterium]